MKEKKWRLSHYLSSMMIISLIMINANILLENERRAENFAVYTFYIFILVIISRFFELKLKIIFLSIQQVIFIFIFILILIVCINIYYSTQYIYIKVSQPPFDWNNSSNDDLKAVYYQDWKTIITDDERQQDAIVCSKNCIYKFPSFSQKRWNSFNSTLIYIRTGQRSYKIDNIFEGDEQLKDVVGIWWETDWIGMSTKDINFPVIIPANQKAIIQIDHKAKNIRLKLYKI